jgi:hypothetical protein
MLNEAAKPGLGTSGRHLAARCSHTSTNYGSMSLHYSSGSDGGGSQVDSSIIKSAMQLPARDLLVVNPGRDMLPMREAWR